MENNRFLEKCFMCGVCFFISGLWAAGAGAAESSPADQYEHMRQFIREENEKIKDIKLLNLDLERASLTLKKKEIESKLAKLSKTQDVYMNPMSAASNTRSSYSLAGVFMTEKYKEALMNVGGALVHVREGQAVDEHVKIKQIKQDSVTLERADGTVLAVKLEG